MVIPAQPDYLLLGQILRPHGILGEVKMRVLTRYPERIADRDSILLAKEPEPKQVTPYALEHVRMHQGYALLKFKGINDRTTAERLRELYAMVAIEDAVPLEDGEVYLYQLLGLQVELSDGTALGQLTEVLETGANDVYIVQSPQYGEVLVPATDETILETDLERGLMVVQLPEGLLPSS